jgi:hypothetical protein
LGGENFAFLERGLGCAVNSKKSGFYRVGHQMNSDRLEGSGVEEGKEGVEDHLSGVGKGRGLVAHSNSSDCVGPVGGEGYLRRKAGDVDPCCC